MLRGVLAFLGSVWVLSKPFWISAEGKKAFWVLAVLVGLNLGMVYLNVMFNEWNRIFFNALQDKDVQAFWREIVRFGFIASGLIVASVLRQFTNQWLQIRWREHMTASLRDRWLGSRTFHTMQVLGLTADNPDQRIADDTRLFVQSALKLTLDLLVNVVTLASFVGILWNLSQGFAIPGALVWLAIAYALAGSVLTYFVGRPLAGLNFEEQKRNADFRFALMRLRENTQAVALSNGEARETQGLAARFARIVENWWGIMVRQMKITGFTTFYAQIAAVLPVLAVAPGYFSGLFPLGVIFQTGNAFAQVYASLSWFVNSFMQLADWKATIMRLEGFNRSMDRAAATAAEGPSPAPGTDPDALTVAGLELSLPGGRKLMENYAQSFRDGENALITGPSGCGKSTLFSAIGGLWPLGRGTIRLPAGRSLMFLPQKPYMPLGTLAEALSYPGEAAEDPAEAHRAALDTVGLGRLASRLGDTESWGQILSLGEQQRLAFARVLLRKPDWLFLDESTSSLDETAEADMYRLMGETFPDMTIVSIGHRGTLKALHDRVVELAPAAARA